MRYTCKTCRSPVPAPAPVGRTVGNVHALLCLTLCPQCGEVGGMTGVDTTPETESEREMVAGIAALCAADFGVALPGIGEVLPPSKRKMKRAKGRTL